MALKKFTQSGIPPRKSKFVTEDEVNNLITSSLASYSGRIRVLTGGGKSEITGVTMTASKYQTKSSDVEGIKIIADAPDIVLGDTGAYLPTTNVEPASPFNGAEWTNPSNAQSVSGTYATASQGASQKFNIWKSFTGLQTAIPSGVTIKGISVRVFASVDTIANLNASGRTLLVQLSKDSSTVVGINRTTDVALIATDAFVSSGGGDDLWGTTWSRSDFDASFGVMITGSGLSSPATVFQIDYIQVTVHYERNFTDGSGETIADSFIQFWNSIGNTLVYLKRNTFDLLIDKASLIIKGTITVEPQEVVATNTGVKFPTANAEPASPNDGKLWTNPANAEANDGVYAVGTQNGGQRFQIWNGFGFSIPDGAIITGIIVDIEAKVNTGTAKINAELTKDGSTLVGNSKLTDDFTTTDSVKTVGSSSDLWGTTWSVGDFGSDFGVMLSGNTSPKTYSVDFINITIHYTTTGDNTIDGNILSTLDDTYGIGSSSKRFASIHARKGNFDEFSAPLTKLNIGTTDISLASTSSKDLASIILPADTLGTDNGIYIRANIDTFLNGASINHSMSFVLEYGTTELIISAIKPDNSVTLEGWVEGWILADGATNAQELWLQFYVSENKINTPGTAIQVLSANKTADATEDSTTALVARLIGRWSNSSSSNTLQVRNSIIQVIK